jgi:ATP-dependent DNA helicase RecQ
MKDQVDAMQASGVAATFLNSSLGGSEVHERLNGLSRGAFKLLYVAPERLMLSGFLDEVQRWQPNLIAIDEAHCISEWGHDFRPEYRQLARLRDVFPAVPMMALTATATERVRTDIVKQLGLREPSCYLASFNRPNLTYRVVPKAEPYQQAYDFIQSRPADSGIIYCHSRKNAEAVASRLNADGIPARAYHAGMETSERSKNQDAFIRDEVRVVCATIAFGMGINKPNVRFVIHYDLPKNVEGYYQETGRAGRDGLPGECLLLFSAGDVVKQERFISEKPDAREQQIAREQLQQMVHYAECGQCRRAVLLNYFGEKLEDGNCGGCDNCLSPRETHDGTLSAQKFLSCIFRIHEHSHFAVGLNHVVEVLTGADTAKVRGWGHNKLSTYGIGTEHKRAEWQAIGRELVRLGYVHQNAARFNVLELTEEGRAVLRNRTKVTLTRPMALPERKLSRIGEITCDEALFERLRSLRRRLADQRGVPPYIIFSDVTLRQMARECPATERELRRISGLGEKKRAEFGALFLDEITAHLAISPRQVFAEHSAGASVAQPRPYLNDTARATLQLFRNGRTVQEIAGERKLTASTICGHLADAIAAGETIDVSALLNPAEHEQMARLFEQFGPLSLGRVKEALGHQFDYGKLHLSRALWERERGVFSAT